MLRTLDDLVLDRTSDNIIIIKVVYDMFHARYDDINFRWLKKREKDREIVSHPRYQRHYERKHTPGIATGSPASDKTYRPAPFH